MSCGALIVSAPRSGSGKTVVALAIMAALARAGRVIRAAKSGPDYIDPAFHAAAAGSPSLNLDSWAMSPTLLNRLVAGASAEADMLVIEGAMGLFDGVLGPPGRTGSAADLARRYHIPVVLVLDVSGQAQTAAAVVRGFAVHDPAVKIAGVVLNRVGSDRHARMVTDAVGAVGVPVLGAIGREDRLTLPERHLGLVQASEHGNLAAFLEHLAELANRCLDLDGLQAVARQTPPLPEPGHGPTRALAPPGQRIALASDAAFTFIYPHVIAGWAEAGAQIERFSPLADEAPPAGCDCCWLPGGYPELHAPALAAAAHFRAGITKFAQSRPVHGECGGHILLGVGLQDARGVLHPMLGLLGHTTSFAARRLHLGYRCVRPLRNSVIGAAGSVLRGHEFHYGTLLEPGADEPLVEMADAQGQLLGRGGSRRGHVSGTFFHAIAEDCG